jgi:hypothetical protein
LAIKEDGTVVAWRINNEGQTNIVGVKNPKAISASTYYSMILV